MQFNVKVFFADPSKLFRRSFIVLVFHEMLPQNVPPVAAAALFTFMMDGHGRPLQCTITME